MAKNMKNPRRVKQTELDKKVYKIELALDQGATTKKRIGEHTKFKLATINEVFKQDKNLYRKFCEIRKTIVDLAADNVMDIVADQDHPKCAEMSKWVLNHYKSDLDETLDAKDSEDVEVEIGEGGRGNRPTVIRFGKKK